MSKSPVKKPEICRKCKKPGKFKGGTVRNPQKNGAGNGTVFTDSAGEGLAVCCPKCPDALRTAPSGKVARLPQAPQDLQILFRPGAAQGVLRRNDQHLALLLQSEKLLSDSRLKAKQIIAAAQEKKEHLLAEAAERQEYCVRQAEKLYSGMRERQLESIEALDDDWQNFLCGLMDSDGSGPSEEYLSAKVGAIARELAEIDDE